jgi:hypothetical protein
MSRKEYIGLPGTYREKMKGTKQPGLDFSRLIRDELRANGYPTKDCADVCNQPDICDLLVDCDFGSGTTTVALGLAGQDLTVTVNGISDVITLPSGGVSISLDPSTNPALTLLAGVLKLDLNVSGSYSNATSGLASTSIQGVIDEIDSLLDNLLARTYDNGITLLSNNVELGGPLVKNTSIDANSFSFNLQKSEVSMDVSSGVTLIPTTGRFAGFRATSPDTTNRAFNGIGTNLGGVPVVGMALLNTTLNETYRHRTDTALNSWLTSFEESALNNNYVQRVGKNGTFFQIDLNGGTFGGGSTYSIGWVSPSFGSQPFVLTAEGLPSYANAAAAAADLPSNSLWVDPNNFVKIVP